MSLPRSEAPGGRCQWRLEMSGSCRLKMSGLREGTSLSLSSLGGVVRRLRPVVGPEIAVVSDAVAVAPDRHDVAVVQDPVDQRRRHRLIAEDVAPLADVPSALKALVARHHRRGPLVAPGHQLEEEHGPARADRQVADLVDDQQCRMGEHFCGWDIRRAAAVAGPRPAPPRGSSRGPRACRSTPVGRARPP